MTDREMTYGERAVGLTFNPSGDPTVARLKELYAAIIDICEENRHHGANGSEEWRLWSLAIDDAQRAQMMAVKAATWRE
jgi:hypothetical protein